MNRLVVDDRLTLASWNAALCDALAQLVLTSPECARALREGEKAVPGPIENESVSSDVSHGGSLIASRMEKLRTAIAVLQHKPVV